MNQNRPFVSSLKRQFIISSILSVAAIFLIISGLGFVLVPYSIHAQNTIFHSPATPRVGTTVDGIECNVSEQFLFHIHTHIDIFVNGRHVLIPSQIGIIPDKCIYWMHTHDGSGIIHIESPIKREFTLGQFLDLWKMKSNNPKVFDSIFSVKGNMPIVYINGSKVQDTTSNYRNIKLSPHQEIVLVYGGRPPTADTKTIPFKYDFPPGL
jgi:hypothetical protein